MTKEERRVYMLKYNKAYKLKNKKELAAKQLIYREGLRDAEYTLYYLKEEHYIGITNQYKFRLLNHKKNGNHILDFEVISKYKTKREALDTERYLHSIGYNGANPNTTKKTYD